MRKPAASRKVGAKSTFSLSRAARRRRDPGRQRTMNGMRRLSSYMNRLS